MGYYIFLSLPILVYSLQVEYSQRIYFKNPKWTSNKTVAVVMRSKQSKHCF